MFLLINIHSIISLIIWIKYKGGLNKSLENIIFNFLNIIHLCINKTRDKNKTLIIKYLKEKG